MQIIIRAVIIQAINIFRATQAIAVVATYYIVVAVFFGLITVIFFNSSDPMVMITTITDNFGLDFVYPEDDTELVMKIYWGIVFIFFLIDLAFDRLKELKKRITYKKLFKIHQNMLFAAYLVLIGIIMPIHFPLDFWPGVLVYSIIFAIFWLMLAYYFAMQSFTTWLIEYIRHLPQSKLHNQNIQAKK